MFAAGSTGPPQNQTEGFIAQTHEQTFMGCSILGPRQNHVQHCPLCLLAGCVFQPQGFLPYHGCAVQGQVCCCTYAVRIDTSSIWTSNTWGVFLRIQLRDRFSPMGRRLSEQIAPSSWDVWSGEYYGAMTTTASAEWSPGCYCIRLKCFPGSDCREYENVETEFILSFNIISQKESTSNGISRGKSSYKTNGFLLSPCQQMINSWCWRCI